MEKEKDKAKEKVKDEYGYNYETLWKIIIRPPRDNYDIQMLSDEKFTYNNKLFYRTDYTLISYQGYRMLASFIQPDDNDRPLAVMPVVIYLHGNSSSRIEGFNIRKYILNLDINLFIFDFPGCGKSEGEYISLGFHEQKDLRIVIDFLSRLPGVGNIGLWGRSMGAATALLYAPLDERIKAICLDSPFADFNRLAKEMVYNMIKLPNFAIEGALAIISRTIKAKNQMDIYDLKPIESATKATIPSIFIHGMQDELINIQHSIDLCQVYVGMKSLRPCKGGHNSVRPRDIMIEIQKFFWTYLKDHSVQQYSQINNEEDDDDNDDNINIDVNLNDNLND